MSVSHEQRPDPLPHARHTWLAMLLLKPLGRTWRRAIIVSLVVIAGVIAIGLSAMPSRMSPVPDSREAVVSSAGDANAAVGASTAVPGAPVSPLLSGTGVLHIKGTIEARTDEGEVPHRWELEFWYDRATEDARFEKKNVLGLRGDHWMLFHEGQTYSIYNPFTGYASSVTEPNVYAMPEPVEKMFHYQARLDAETLVKADGEPAPDGQIALVRPGEVPSGTPVVFLEEATGLVRKLRDVHWWRGHDGDHLYEYPVIETLDRDSLPPDLFSIHALTTVPPSPTESHLPTPESNPTVSPTR